MCVRPDGFDERRQPAPRQQTWPLDTRRRPRECPALRRRRAPLRPSSRVVLQTAFVAAWLVHRCTAGDREVPLTLQNPVLPEAVKLVLAVLFFVWQRRRRGPARGYAPPREESLPLSGVDEDGVYVRDEESRAKSVAQLHGGTRVPPSVASACVLLAAVLFTLYKHNVRGMQHSNVHTRY